LLVALLLVACGGSGLPQKPGVVFATLPQGAGALVADGSALYVGLAHDGVARVDTTSGAAAIVVPLGTEAFMPSVAVGPEQVFKTKMNGEIEAWPKSGGAPSTVVPGELRSVALRFDGTRLWWMSQTCSLRTVDPGSATARTVGTADPCMYAVDSSEAFWRQSNGMLVRSTNGGDPVAVASPLTLNGFALAVAGDWVWFGDGNALKRIHRTGDSLQTVASFTAPIREISATVDAVAVWTLQFLDASSLRADEAEGNASRAPLGSAFLRDSASRPPASPRIEIYSVSAAGGDPALAGTLASYGTSIALVGGVVYWVTGNTILRPQR
jgi:hypothetical protein